MSKVSEVGFPWMKRKIIKSSTDPNVAHEIN